MGSTQTKKLEYKGFRIAQGFGDWLAFKRGDLVAGEDTLKQLKHTLDRMVEQNVKHESELKDEQ